MQDRARRNPKIEFLWNVAVDEILGDAPNGGVTGVAVVDTVTGARRSVPLEGPLIASGHEPNPRLVAGQLGTDPRGYILTPAGCRSRGCDGWRSSAPGTGGHGRSSRRPARGPRRSPRRCRTGWAGARGSRARQRSAGGWRGTTRSSWRR